MSDDASPQFTTLALVLELLLLALVIILGHALERHHVKWIGEAGAALSLGLIIGLFLSVVGLGDGVSQRLTFNSNIFLLIMLPTIMFDAGYSMDPTPFVRNIGAICMFAFAGTTISTFVVGLFMWGMGVAGWCEQLSLLENLAFGAIISATDPVTVLAIFNKLGAQEDLYINVFGESVLNDAVAMVLFETIKGFKGMEVTVSSVFAGIGMFVGIFLGSVAMGIVIGLLAALLFRSRWLASREDGNAEVGIVLVVAFISFLGAQAAHLSGICSILFCGMVMRRYVRPNLSSTACTKIDSLFKTMAALFELFLFVYIGLTLFLVPEHYNIWAYTALVLIALGLSRAANILPCAAIVNHLRHPHLRMPAKHQFMMWWAGLRGAMAFALSVQASEDFGAAGEVMKTCTFYVIFITVLVNGGSCAHLIERLDLKAPTGPAVAADQPLITITTLTSPATNSHSDNGPDPSPSPGPAKPRPHSSSTCCCLPPLPRACPGCHKADTCVHVGPTHPLLGHAK
ncbi:Sodium/hydrogen exchanger family-domain-containing protein [Haematococcus lacustris]